MVGETLMDKEKTREYQRKQKLKKNSLAGQSVLDVDTHERADEVFCFLADVVPVGGVKLKLPWSKR